ncbi:MAG TPA: hypothetical protein VIO61_16075 [Anaerolineaceae bacterium]
MENYLRSLLIIVFQFLSLAFVILAAIAPIVIGIRKLINEKSLEVSDLAIKIPFFFIYCAIFSSSFLIAIKDPQNILGALISGIGLSIVTLLFLGIILIMTKRTKRK